MFEKYIEFSRDRIEHIREEITKFKPIKFVMYYNGENYIFTSYSPKNYSSIILLQNRNKDILYIKNCTCGYKGAGPHCTVEILKIFSFTQSNAEKLTFNNAAICFDIDDNLQYIENSICTQSFFEWRNYYTKDNQVRLTEDIKVNVPYKEIFVFNAQDNLSQLMKIFDKIHSMKLNVYSVEYYIGYDSLNKRNFNLPNYFLNSPSSSDIRGPYFSIHTNTIDLTCFVKEEFAVSLMNVMNRLIIGENLFNNDLYNIYRLNSEKAALLASILRYVKIAVKNFRNNEFYKQYRFSNSDRRDIYYHDSNNRISENIFPK